MPAQLLQHPAQGRQADCHVAVPLQALGQFSQGQVGLVLQPLPKFVARRGTDFGMTPGALAYRHQFAAASKAT